MSRNKFKKFGILLVSQCIFLRKDKNEKKIKVLVKQGLINGAAGENRTHDPVLTKVNSYKNIENAFLNKKQ